MKWKLQTNTLFGWANWYIQKWDLFFEEFLCQNKALSAEDRQRYTIYFKKSTEESYMAFREIIQILDLVLLDVETLQYNQRALVASAMYLMIGKHQQQFDLNTIVNDFSRSSMFLCHDLEDFNEFFSVFLMRYFELELNDLFPTIQYIAPYFAVEISYEMPYAAKTKAKTNAKVRLEIMSCLNLYLGTL